MVDCTCQQYNNANNHPLPLCHVLSFTHHGWTLHSKNNTTTLIICPILFLTPCPALAHHGWTLHINFQRPLHFTACRHDGLLGAGRTTLALHQVPILPTHFQPSFFLEILETAALAEIWTKRFPGLYHPGPAKLWFSRKVFSNFAIHGLITSLILVGFVMGKYRSPVLLHVFYFSLKSS